METRITGIPASEGIAMGPVKKLHRQVVEATARVLEPGEVEAEQGRFRQAVETCAHDLAGMISDCAGTERADILRAHLTILQDPYLEQLTMEHIAARNNAEQALQLATHEIGEQFALLEDEALRERVADMNDESARILRRLMGIQENGFGRLDTPVVVVAPDLSPSDTAAMDLEHVLALATGLGGKTSHTAIMARGLGIPAIVGAGAALFDAVQDGDQIIVDGAEGVVLVNPDAATLACYREKQRVFRQTQRELAALRDLPAITTDGHRVELFGNIGSQPEAKAAFANGAEGIGLFRTEFMYMESCHWPSEDEQTAVYRQVAKAMQGRPVIVRTLDIGGDKALPYHVFDHEENPFLGHRAIRFCLANPAIFKTQLRAILRASTQGKLRIMLPMVVAEDELTAARGLLQACMNELAAEGQAFDRDILLGIMIETPASVLLADRFAKLVDFFSIGTNDLTQYILAADRGNEKLQALYSPFHPAVLAAVHRVINAAHAAHIPVGMCGEFAGDPKAARLLLGMGLDEFSVSPGAIPRLKKGIREASFTETKALAEEALGLPTTAAVESLLDKR